MSRLTLSSLLCAAVFLGTSVSQAVVVTPPTFTWTGTGSNSDVTNTSNWIDNTAPVLNDGSTTLETLIFPDFRSSYVFFPSNVDIYGLNVTGHYHFNGAVNLNLGAGGLTYSSTYPTHLAFEYYLGTNITTDQTWNIGPNARVEFYNNAFITGTGKITKTGAGLLDPGSANDGWSGGLQFNEGTIVLRPGYQSQGTETLIDDTYLSRSLGTGTVTIGPDIASRPTFVVYDWSNSTSGGGSDKVELANNFVLNGVFSSKNETELGLTGSVTLNIDTTFRTTGDVTVIEGSIGEFGGARKLTVDSTSALVLYGGSNWTGGTDVTKGVLIFGGENNLPGTGSILVATDGYVGIGNANSVSGFIGKISSASTGTVGFDSNPDGLPDSFNTATTIDLSGFNAALRLGSATTAILSSAVTITPFGTNYRFGGGGGWLQVGSELTSGRTVTLDSPAELPLTVRFTNTSNAFSSVSVTNSGAVFAPGALPGAATLNLVSGAYLGTEDTAFSANATALNSYLARFGATTPGIIGFDIDQFNIAAATRVVDLTGANIGSLTGGAYLGTASALYNLEVGEIVGPGVRFTGTIAPNSDSVHRFAAYKGGALEIAGNLTGSAMIIGHPSALGAFGDRTREEYSTVLISGNNGSGLSGGTTFYGGRLMVGQAAGDGVIGTDPTHALGSGTLTVAPVTFSIEEEDGPETPSPMLAVYDTVPTDANNIIISNPIVLNAPELNVGGESNFTLSGSISGPGGLYVGEESDYGFTLTLSGANTYSGGTYVSNGAILIAGSNTALGNGQLGFGGSSDSEVQFTTTAPVVHGLESNNYGVLSLTADNTILTLNQNFDSQFFGEIYSDSLNATARLVKTGAGTLHLNGNNNEGSSGFYAYGFGGTALSNNPNVSIIVEQGALVVGSNFYLENAASTIWVKGGATLGVDGGAYVYNPIAIDSGGRIAGFGFFESVTVGNGAMLSPGLAGTGNIGMLGIDHLELNSGGILEWHIQNPDASVFGRDFVHVGLDEQPATLVINATSTNKFTLKIISLDIAGVAGGSLSGIDPGHGLYAWTLFSYDALSVTAGTFDPEAFMLDLSQFSTTAGLGTNAGTFSIFLQNNQIMLGFTPVPEPSTYALMALGLGFIGLTVWRKRRAS